MKTSPLLLLAAASLAVAACTPKDAKSEVSSDAKGQAPADPQGQKPATANTPEPAMKQGDLPAPPDVAAAPADAEKTPSGLASKQLQAGTGTVKPTASAIVEVHYTGWTTDGKMFDSSVVRNERISFPLNGVIKGWTEGLQLMVVGEKRRFWIPADMAYGETPSRPGAPSGMLVFDVELFDIVDVPADVKAAPADAQKTGSGLAYKILEKGTGATKAKASDTVEVHYAGWTVDGRMFDASYKRGRPARFPLSGVIKGWTEGVQLLAEGDKARFWIPADLAYGETPSRPGAPAGMLVFDIKLLKINP